MATKGMHIGAIAYKKFDLNGRSSNRLMVLLDRLERFSESHNFKTLLSEILETAREVMDTESSSLMLLDRKTGELVVKIPSRAEGESRPDKRIPKFEGYCGWSVQHEIPLMVNEVDITSSLYQPELYENYHLKNLICAPLINKKGKIMGVIQIANRIGEEGFEKDDLPIFQELAKHAARAIEETITKGSPDNLLEEKKLMVSELHHRMKNNLDLISNMVEMEESKLSDSAGKEVLKKIQVRVKSINIVYDLLAGKEDKSEIDLRPYIKQLVENISQALSTPVRDISIEVNIDEIRLHPERTLAFGLILNELIVNSYKHAFKYKSEGSIVINISRSGGTIILNYKDNGIGMPVDFDEEEFASQGFKLIYSLTEKLYGDFSFNKKTGYKGLECTLEFPDFDYVHSD
ncbi:MAG: histidine kinase dimerization/phosphoacceptor domain -containing protein [Candidatus Halalkalibacterium sp. M3_1C_030]